VNLVKRHAVLVDHTAFGFRVGGFALSVEFRVEGLGLGVGGLGFRVWGFGFRVAGLGFRVWSLEVGVWGLGFGV